MLLAQVWVAGLGLACLGAPLLGLTAQPSMGLQVGRDSRPVMRAAYECFRTGAQPDSILQASPFAAAPGCCLPGWHVMPIQPWAHRAVDCGHGW